MNLRSPRLALLHFAFGGIVSCIYSAAYQANSGQAASTTVVVNVKGADTGRRSR